MSFIGDIVAAKSAAAIGEYNAAVNTEQAKYWNAKAEQDRAIFHQLDRPRLVKQQNRDYSNFFVNTLMTGAEFSGTNYAMALAYKIEQGTDLVIADHNESIAFMENRNQSLLYETKALGDIYKGKLGKVTGYAKATGSLLSTANQQYGWIG